MRTIVKGSPPPELTHWIGQNPHGRYNDLDKTSAGRDARRAIRRTAIGEQHCLCAYCCDRIEEDSSHNEHLTPQSRAPHLTVDFNNIVASCNAKNQCGAAHGDWLLPMTPLDAACATDLQFYLTGKVDGHSQDAKTAIDLLNLNNPALQYKRKGMVDCLIFAAGTTPANLQQEEDAFLEIFLEDMQQPNADGCLLAYSPVLVNILRQYLAA
ncbi:MAG: TIGR02646 family protein [Magnetococcus sp. XQGC-1]